MRNNKFSKDVCFTYIPISLYTPFFEIIFYFLLFLSLVFLCIISLCLITFGMSLAFNVSLHRFLRVVDRFNSLLVSAFITPGGTVMLLLHNGRAPEESVRSFFSEASELFAKHIMNPFAILGTKVFCKICIKVENLYSISIDIYNMNLIAYCRVHPSIPYIYSVREALPFFVIYNQELRVVSSSLMLLTFLMISILFFSLFSSIFIHSFYQIRFLFVIFLLSFVFLRCSYDFNKWLFSVI